PSDRKGGFQRARTRCPPDRHSPPGGSYDVCRRRTARSGGALKPKQPTVYDVAQHAGVSIATVSRVLRGPQSVRESTRERVLESVHDLGYVPSASARGLAGRSTQVLGLLFPGETQRPAKNIAKSTTAAGIEFIDDRSNASASSANHLYFDELIQGAEDAAWHAGYALMVAAGRDMSESVALDDVTGRVDALAVLAQTIDDTVLARRSEEHTSELQSRFDLVCRLLLE